METEQQNGCFTLFLVKSPLIYILFSMVLQKVSISGADAGMAEQIFYSLDKDGDDRNIKIF